MQMDSTHIKSKKPLYLQYGIAFVSVSAIWLFRAWIHPVIGSYAPLPPFLIAVAITAWFGGFGPGLVSAVLGLMMGSYSFLEPYASFHQAKLYHAWVESLFLPEAVLLCVLSSLLHKTRMTAEKASQAKSYFLANVSHEMRTPLTAIAGFSDILASEQADLATPEERKQWAKAIQRNSQLLSRIILDILDLSKVEAQALRVDLQTFNLQMLIGDVENLLKPQAEKKGLEFAVDISANVPLFIKTDPYRLQQILINLIGNAIKFTSSGFVRLTIAANSQKLYNLIFTIEDSGLGLSEMDQKDLFKPFSRINDKGKDTGGNGLGLVLSKHLAKLLGGDVKLLASTPTIGSTFVLDISYIRVDQKEFAQKISDTHSDSTHLSKCARILLVDDAPDNRMLIGHILTMAGAHVEYAENGLEATEKSKFSKFDCFLVDLQMPVMDGYDTAAHLRHDGVATPIIALTAHGFENEKQRALNSGFNGFLTKPIVNKNLIETINLFI